VPHPFLGYVSYSPPSGWAVVERAIVASPLVMGGHGLGIFLASVSRSSTSNTTPQGVVFPPAGRVYFFIACEQPMGLIYCRAVSTMSVYGGIVQG
jgi:hypothetical protein